MMRRLAAIAFVMVLLSTPLALSDDSVRQRRMGVVFREGVPHLFYSARDLINGAAEKKLDSGLPQRIVVSHLVYSPRRAEPLSVSGHSCRVVYDLWQAAYRVEIDTLGGGTKTEIMSTRAEVLDRCLVMRDVPLGQARDYVGRDRIYVASLLELNPLSSTTIARIRRWLSRPRGDDLDGRSFFGSFVSLFVNDRIGSAERILRLRSQDVECR
jgi:hypothetical protein